MYTQPYRQAQNGNPGSETELPKSGTGNSSREFCGSVIGLIKNEP
jgi:hypothetical protein